MMQGYYLNGFGSSSGAGLFGYGWMVFAMGFGLILVLGVVLWLVWSQRTATAHGTTPLPTLFTPAAATPDTAEQIARERFARGEIDRDEYDRVLGALRTR